MPEAPLYVRIADSITQQMACGTPEPQVEARATPPTVVGTRAILSEIMASANDPANVPFGAGGAHPDLYPTRRLNQILRRVVREHPFHSMRYEFPPGLEALRRQVARRASTAGCRLSPDDVTVTCGRWRRSI